MYQLPRIFSQGASIILKILHFMTMSITQADAKASTGDIIYQPSHVWRIQMKSQFVMSNLGILAERWMWSRCKQNNNELNLHICFRQINSSHDYFPWLLFSIWFGGHMITKSRIYCKGFVIETEALINHSCIYELFIFIHLLRLILLFYSCAAHECHISNDLLSDWY